VSVYFRLRERVLRYKKFTYWYHNFKILQYRILEAGAYGVLCRAITYAMASVGNTEQEDDLK
jgi:hypothetical protein